MLRGHKNKPINIFKRNMQANQELEKAEFWFNSNKLTINAKKN